MAASIINVVLGLSAKSFDDGLKRAEMNLKRTSKQLESIGRSMAMYITAPILGAAAASVKFAADFETSLVKIENLVGATSSELALMQDEIKRIGKESGVSTNQLADGLYNIMGAGLKGAAAIQVLEESAKLSAIGLGEANVIGKTLVATLAAYGSENISASRAANILMATVKEGNTEASELAPALGRVIAIAAEMGVSFEEVGASIATFTRLGVSSEEAVTGLRSALANIMKPGEQARESLAQIGLTFDDLRNKIKTEGLAETLVGLVRAFDGNTEAVARIIPDIQGLTAVLATAGSQGDDYISVLNEITNSTDIVDMAMERVSETATFKFNAALNSLKTTGVEIGSNLLPIVAKIADKVEALSNRFSSLSKSTQKTIIYTSLLVAGIAPLILTTAKLASGMAILMGIIRGVTAAKALLYAEIIAVVAAAAALAAGAIYVVRNWDAIKESFMNLFRVIDNFLISSLTSLLEIIKKGADAIGLNILDDTIDRLKNSKKEVVSASDKFVSFSEIFNGIKQSITGANEAIETTTGSISTITEEIKQSTSATKEWEKSINDVIEKNKSFVGGWRYLTQMVDKIDQAKTKYLELINSHKNFIAELRKQPDIQLNLVGGDKAIQDAESFAESVSNSFKQASSSAITGTAIILGEMLMMNQGFNDIAKTIGLFLLDTLGNLMIQVGEAAIAVGLAVEGIRKALMTLNPAVAIIAGIALVALGGLVKGYLSKVSQSSGSETPRPFADGGIVSSPTNALIGEYPGASRNPEVVAPLDKLTGIMANALTQIGMMPQSYGQMYGQPILTGGATMQSARLQVEVVGRLDGKDIYLSSKRYNNTINRTT